MRARASGRAFPTNLLQLPAMESPIPPKLDVVDDDMAAILRTKTEAERLAIAHGMWRYARRVILNVLRSEHPEWDDAQLQREAARRLSHGAA